MMHGQTKIKFTCIKASVCGYLQEQWQRQFLSFCLKPNDVDKNEPLFETKHTKLIRENELQFI